MTRDQAHAEAHRRWGTKGANTGDRYGIVCQRRTKRPLYEIGFHTRLEKGAVSYTQMGISDESWEAAFADADSKPAASPPATATKEQK